MINDGGPAFPSGSQTGVSARFYAAVHIAANLAATTEYFDVDAIAGDALRLADALIAHQQDEVVELADPQPQPEPTP